jgi:hypothetical protein
MLKGLPDLGRPLNAPGSVFAAFERPDLAVALPDRLLLERDPDGSPALLLTLVRGGTGVGSTGGLLELGVAADADLAAAGAALAAAGTPARLTGATLEGGVLALSARLGPAVPEELVPALPLTPDQLTRARAMAELDATGATLAARLLTTGTLPATATVRVTVRAVAPRLPLTVTVDPHAVALRLARRFGAGAAVTLEELASGLDELLADPAVTVEGDTATLDGEARRRVLGLRLAERFTIPEPAATLRLRLRDPGEVPSGHERRDLAEPAAVALHRLLSFDPFALARDLAGGSADRLVRTVDVPELVTGRTTITLMSNLPEPVAGLIALFADLRVPPAPPRRPQPVTAGGTLDPPDRTAVVTVTLAPGEDLAGEARLRALLEGSDGAAELEGPWQPATRTPLRLAGDAFPVPLTVLRASAALLGDAVVEVRGERRTVARLDTGTPTAGVPRLAGDGPLRLVVRPTGPGQTIEEPLGEEPRIDLDAATLPGFGAHQAQVTTGRAPGPAGLLVEWQAEGASDPEAVLGSVRLSSERPSADIGWTATSPFQPGVRLRVSGAGSPGSWSRPIAPAEGLVIMVDGAGDDRQAVVVDGVELRPDPADPWAWVYVPPGPFVDAGTDGRPAIGLIEAGPVAFLQVTTCLDMTETARDGLQATLRRRHGTRAMVRAMPVVVRRTAVELRGPDGSWTAVAEGTGSGIAPWTTALSATLTADQAGAVRAAMDGRRDAVRLAAIFDVPGTAAIERDRTATTGAATTTTTTTAATTTTATAEVHVTEELSSAGPAPARTVQQTHDLADLLAAT